MSDDLETIHLGLPYLAPAQAQKHVTHNEALRMLDAMLHIRVEDSGRDEPPGSPAEGQRHLLGNAPAGAFAGQAGAIAAWSANAYRLYGYGSFDSLLRVLTGSPGMEENSAVPFQLVTPESAQGLTLPYEAPADALEQYRALWKW